MTNHAHESPGSDSHTSPTEKTSTAAADFLHAAASPVPAISAANEAVPQRIGKYRILRRLGEGGFGVVYQAVSDDGIRRMVALKVLRPGVAHPNSIRRFLREREILPALHHPNIAGFLDADETEDGRPFYVMEYVDGKRLTDYCDQNNLTIEERLQLFERICDAVQHAHSRMILHRDLKPSNILVDKEGQPKLLDFGIARMVSRDMEASADLMTVGDDVALTPEYASPEQLRGDTLGTESDVYSLGVIFYELLTARRPYELKSRLRVAAAKLVEEATVMAPSERVSQVDGSDQTSVDPATARTMDATTTASRRGTTVDRLRRNLSGDLDNICLMALRKETRRRYPSAQALLDDLRRHRSGLPVTARGDNVAYRLGKWMRRHRVAVTAALLVGVVGTWTAVVQYQSLGARARLAEERAALSQSLMADFVTEASAFGGSLQARSAGLAIVQRALGNLSRQADDDPSISVHAAEAGNAMLDGFLAVLSGGWITAQALGERGLREIATPTVERWRRLSDEDQRDPTRRAGLAMALALQAQLKLRMQQFEAARTDAEAAREVAREAAVLTPNPTIAARRARVIALWTLGSVNERSRVDEARSTLSEARLEAVALAQHPEATPLDREAATRVLGSLGNLKEQEARAKADVTALAEARGLYEEAIRQAKAWVDREPPASQDTKGVRAARALMDALQRAARSYFLGKDEDLNLELSQRYIDEMERVAASLRPLDPDIIQRLSDMARAKELRGHYLEKASQPPEAARSYEAARALVDQARAIQGDESASPELSAWVIHLHVCAGEALVSANGREAARANWLAADREASRQRPKTATALAELLLAQARLARLATSAGNHEDAERWLDAASTTERERDALPDALGQVDILANAELDSLRKELAGTTR